MHYNIGVGLVKMMKIHKAQIWKRK